MKARQVLIGCGVVFAVIVVVFLAGSYYVMRTFGAQMMKMSKSPGVPKVIVGSNVFGKSIFFKDPNLGVVTDIRPGKMDPAPGVALSIVATNGADFVDLAGKVRSSVRFTSSLSHPDAVDVNGDDICEFLDRGSWSAPAGLLDHSGKVMWSFGTGSAGVDDAAWGDVNGDGKPEFVVGFNGAGGVSLVDDHGKKIWSRPDGNVWHVEMADVNGDGRPEIIHSNASGKMTVRDAGGNIISRSHTPIYFSSFSLCSVPNTNNTCALAAEEDKVWLLDYQGKEIARYDGPQCGSLGQAHGVAVSVGNGKPKYFAVLVSERRCNASILYIYDSARKLVYQEILPDNGQAISVIPSKNPGVDDILVGGLNKVWKYELVSTSRAVKPLGNSASGISHARTSVGLSRLGSVHRRL